MMAVERVKPERAGRTMGEVVKKWRKQREINRRNRVEQRGRCWVGQ